MFKTYDEARQRKDALSEVLLGEHGVNCVRTCKVSCSDSAWFTVRIGVSAKPSSEDIDAMQQALARKNVAHELFADSFFVTSAPRAEI